MGATNSQSAAQYSKITATNLHYICWSNLAVGAFELQSPRNSLLTNGPMNLRVICCNVLQQTGYQLVVTRYLLLANSCYQLAVPHSIIAMLSHPLQGVLP